MLGERHGGGERAAPRAEVLRREVVAQVLGDVRIECRGAEVHRFAVALVPEKARAPLVAHERANRIGELLVDERRAHDDAMLGTEAKRHPPGRAP